MKKINLIITGILLLFLCSACQEVSYAHLNPLVKDLFCFKTGSEWTYYDSISQTTTKMVVTNYEIRKFAPTPEGGRRKIYDCAESIRIDFTVENTVQSFKTWLKADIDNDNTANGYIFTPTKQHLNIRCDENNNFIPPASATYLNTYTVNGILYSDVYMFNYKNVTYYISKHIGFIRCVENNYIDLVLIDKNILQ